MNKAIVLPELRLSSNRSNFKNNIRMKKFSFILFLALLCSACSDNQMQDDLVTIDVTASYPEKKLVLQDFMDVEYIPLETTDDILCAGSVWAVSEHLILATNFNQDGNIFLFDRESGKALRKINHKGQSGEEYTSALGFVLDEENNELYVSDTYGRKILVYDLDGNFKRKLSWKGDFMFGEIFSFDQKHLICQDILNENNTVIRSAQSFMLLSKQNGSITKTIQIPFKDKKSIIIRTPVDDSGMCYAYAPSTSHPVVPYFDDFMLAEYSSDTIYQYTPNGAMEPIIARTPSVQTMNPEVFLFPTMFTDRYYFVEAVEKTMEFKTTDIVYDKQEKNLFTYKIYNDDYAYEKEAFLKSRPLNSEVPTWQFLDADELVDDFENGKLKGKLKEVASRLHEDDNPVIMLIKYK